MEYFGREYSVTVDASFNNGSSWTTGTTTCTWSSPKFRISYNLNGGSGSSLALDEVKESGDVLNSGATLSKTGFVFAGWNTKADGSGTNYPIVSNQIPFTPPTGKNHIQSHTLYAVWNSNSNVNTNTYIISYDDNLSDGGSAPNNQLKTHGVDITLASNTGNLIRTGFNFDGWNDAADGTGTDYAESATYSTDANLTLYAKWTAVTYIISYDENGANGGTVPNDQTKTHDVDINLASNSGNLVKTGFTFDGWNDAADGTGMDYAESSTYTTDANLTLYAKWTATNLNISQDLIGSQGDFIDDGQNGSISYSVGEPIIFTINNQITQGFQQPNDVNNSSMVLNEISSKPNLKSPLNNQNSTNLLSSHDLNVKIYPNPSDGEKIMLEANGFNHSIGKYNIKIFDVSSKLIGEFNQESNDYLFMEINFSKQLVNGFYFLNIKKGEDQIIKKFIVK